MLIDGDYTPVRRTQRDEACRHMTQDKNRGFYSAICRNVSRLMLMDGNGR